MPVMFSRGNPTGGTFGTYGVAYAKKRLPDDYSGPVYSTSKIAFTDNIPNGSGIDTANFVALVNETQYFSENQTRLSTICRDGAGRWGDTSGGLNSHSTVPDFVSQQWYYLECVYDQGSTQNAVISCDGGWTTSTSGRNDDEPVQSFYVGGWAPTVGFFAEGFYKSIEMYTAHVKIGTTRWDNDIFEDDFSSGDFSAWTSRSGWSGTEGVVNPGDYGCTLVDEPNFAPFNEQCPAFGVIPREARVWSHPARNPNS